MKPKSFALRSCGSGVMLLLMLTAFLGIPRLEAQTSGVWTWMSGGNTTNNPAVYGTRGTGTTSTMPGARYGVSGGAGSIGNFWIFGGTDGYGNYLNDLWTYIPSTGIWTWISGNSAPNRVGVYGNQGVAATGNMPGARYSQSGWMDPSGNIWIFGGLGYDANGNAGFLDDLWKFNTSTMQWTWVSGSSAPNSVGVYGTPGASAPSDVPGARVTNSWTDAAGNIWTFGGGGYDMAGSTGGLNDLWEYSTSTGQWTWVNGSNTVNSEDRAGNVTWSSVVELTRTGYTHTSVYPNPAFSGVTLQVDGDGLLNTPATLLDVSGKLLGVQIITGQQQYFDLHRLAGGIYILRLADGTTIKILKQ